MSWSLALDPHWALPRWETRHELRPRCIYDLSWLDLIWKLKDRLLFSQLPSSTIWTAKTHCWRSNRLLFGAYNGFQPFWKTTNLTTLLWCYIKSHLADLSTTTCLYWIVWSAFRPSKGVLQRVSSNVADCRSNRGQDQNRADVPFCCFVSAWKYLRSVIRTSGSPCCSFVLYTMHKKLRQMKQTL